MMKLVLTSDAEHEIAERRQVTQLADRLDDGRPVKVSDFKFIYKRLQLIAILLDALKNSTYQLSKDVPDISQVELQLFKVADVLDGYISTAQVESEDDIFVTPSRPQVI